METARIQTPRATARSILSPLRSRSSSFLAIVGGDPSKAPPPATKPSGRENSHPNAQIDPPNSSPLAFPRKASPRKHDNLLLKKPSRPAHELPADDKSLGPSDTSAVKVVVRVRPGHDQNTVNGGVIRKISSDSLAAGDRTFSFHSVLGPESTQEDVFETVGVPILNSSLAGFNTSILSYGQSGSGKTYTLWGPAGAMVDGASVNSEQGIAPRLFKMLFSEIRRKQERSEAKQFNFQCRCSFLEVYNNQINDLLDPTQRNLQIRDDTKHGSHVENLTDEYVTTVEDVTQLLVKGLANRKVGATSMNSKSSRSHIIFTCIVETWCKLSASTCFTSSNTSKITLVDLAGSDDGMHDAVGKQFVAERKHIRKSLSKLGKLVNILGEAEYSSESQNIPYKDSCLTHLLQETLGGNAKVAVICAISQDESSRAGTLSTLRFGERARQMQNKAVINEITEDDVNDLSDQIRQLKEELMRAKLDEGKSIGVADGHFNGRNCRQSLNLLRVSLNRSLILPHIEQEYDEEVVVEGEDVSELCVQLSNLNASIEATSKDSIEKKDATCSFLVEDPNAEQESQIESFMVDSCDDEVTFNSFNKHTRLVEIHLEVPKSVIADNGIVSVDGEECDEVSGNKNTCIVSVRKSDLTSPSQRQTTPDDPTLCSSPKLRNPLRKSFAASDMPRPNLHIESVRKSPDLVRSSFQRASATDSLAASLQRGLQIIDYHERNSTARSSIVALSFEHLSSLSTQTKEKADALDGVASSLLCSSCKSVIDGNACKEASEKSYMQIVPVKEDISGTSANATTRENELEALCAEQATKIENLNFFVDNHTVEEGQGKENVLHPINHSLRHDERATLILEIESLKNQLKTVKNVNEDDCLLEQIRNGSLGYEEEQLKWTESESRWISLTEELRADLDRHRSFAEKKETELNLEKSCTAELNDALQRSILGHVKFVEHYAELQEKYEELLLKHRKVMEGIAQVKKAAAKAGRKGCGSAFAAALAAELSTLRIDREKERADLKEQNRKLRIQARDTAEAVHAAGELLVRLREAEAAASLAEGKYGAAQQEVEKMKKQMEKQKRKHAMELVTMKHFLAESRLPDSALEPLYHHESEIMEENKANICDDDQSWRSAFRPIPIGSDGK